MLDVHPPHEAAHSWKDFLIHIATIVIGLLVAIGLEQSVEWMHHRQQVAETRRALAEERQQSIEEFARTTRVFRLETARFQTNLAVLKYVEKHPGSRPESWPGAMNWHNYIVSFTDAAWETAQHDNVTALMPQREVRKAERLYFQLGVVQASGGERLRQIELARRYTALDADPSHLSPEDLRDAIHGAEAVLIAHYRLGAGMRNLHANEKDFTPSPNTDELLAIVHEAPKSAEELRAMGLEGLSNDLKAAKDKP